MRRSGVTVPAISRQKLTGKSPKTQPRPFSGERPTKIHRKLLGIHRIDPTSHDFDEICQKRKGATTGWEPPHGPFKLEHPWKEYLKIGDLVRKCACHLLLLNGNLNSKSEEPTEFERRTEEACKRMITESSKALKELSLSIKTMTQPFSSIIHISNAKNVIDDLKHTLGTSETFFQHDESCVMDFIPVASVMSLLIAINECVDEISKVVEAL
ncbi:hypothetical protein CQW23_33440 [Capsicum baccatum]|uniref:Aluminum-activated malate transporter 8 n=1 Tax=Capsicum baccatum TaxID=33114 RepID=A0A2G2V1V5_CAPBA|nr:hypothetical protein CQW23_33440 [Capsicum baccatum]